jgi:hypothetical protein
VIVAVQQIKTLGRNAPVFVDLITDLRIEQYRIVEQSGMHRMSNCAANGAQAQTRQVEIKSQMFRWRVVVRHSTP